VDPPDKASAIILFSGGGKMPHDGVVSEGQDLWTVSQNLYLFVSDMLQRGHWRRCDAQRQSQ